MSGEGYIYVIGEAPRYAAVKIGWAKDINRRRAELQGGNPRRLRILASHPGSREIEAGIHALAMAARIRGEWFDVEKLYELGGLAMPPELVACLKRAVA